MTNPRLGLFFLLMVLLAARPAAAEIIIGVFPFQSNPVPADSEAAADVRPGNDEFGHGMGQSISDQMVRLKNDNEAFKSCSAVIVEIANRDLIQKELDFQQSEWVDPATRGDPNGLLDPNRLVTGAMSVRQSTFEWFIEVTNPTTGERSMLSEGTAKIADRLKVADAIALEILEKICKPKAYHITGGLNDLTIDSKICDITKPFSFNGTGQSAGLKFSFVPATDATGIWVVSGTAAGVIWSGGGTYHVIEVKQSMGLMMDGAWHIKTPLGNFPYKGVIPNELAELRDGCKT